LSVLGVHRGIANGLVGLAFAIVYLATGRNLWAAILAHGVMDTTGVSFLPIVRHTLPGIGGQAFPPDWGPPVYGS
jgi:membrane protease YdiL (CAAX protease family)